MSEAIYEDEHVVVKPSGIEGLGVFAKRDFKKGETVFKWNPLKALTEEELASMPESEKRYVNPLEDGTKVLMNIPERYMNHSCDANTNALGNADVAIRDIKAGEEITADYFTEGAATEMGFSCSCASEHCRGNIVKTEK